MNSPFSHELSKVDQPIWHRFNRSTSRFVVQGLMIAHENGTDVIFPTSNALAERGELAVDPKDARERLSYLRQRKYLLQNSTGEDRYNPYLPHRPESARFLLLAFNMFANSRPFTTSKFASEAEHEKIKNVDVLLDKAFVTGYLDKPLRACEVLRPSLRLDRHLFLLRELARAEYSSQ
jgi:hypothetical protein